MTQDSVDPTENPEPMSEAASVPKKRARAPRKAAVTEGAGAMTSPAEGAAATGESIESGVPAAAAPVKRAPRKRAAKVAPGVPEAVPVEGPHAEPVAVSEAASASPDAHERPLFSLAPAVEADGAGPSGADVPRERDGMEAEGGGRLGAEAGGDRGTDGDADGDAQGDGEGGRGRNRRRGRRGGRGEAEAGVASAPSSSGEGASLTAPDTSDLFAAVLSGDFDEGSDGAADSAETLTGAQVDVASADGDAGEDKRVLAPDPDAPKLHKVLAQSGIGSRRDMEQAIQDGRVKVNQEVAHTGMRISFGDRVTLDDKPVRVRIAPPPPRIIAYHKPVGEVVTLDDPQQRPTVFRRLPRLAQGKWQSVGRLDINTEGLLLFTTSGDLANKLMHPRFGVEREYAVRVLGTLGDEQREQLLAGVQIDGQAASFKAIVAGGGEGVNHWYRVVITEGRNREVRKLFDAVGLTVSRLIRVRYGCVVLPRGLKRGAWVDLPEADVKALRQIAGQPQPRGDRPSGDRPSSERQGGDRRSQGQAPAKGRGPQPAQAGRQDRQAMPPGGKPARPPKPPRPQQQGGDELPREYREPGDPSRIPNPLMQTYDKRAYLSDKARGGRREEDFEDGPIPNPLQQTYDKRFVQGGAQGFSGPKMRNKPSKGGSSGGAQRQPDPMQTAVGYIGADAFTRKMQNQGRGGGGGSSKGGGGGRRRGGR